MKQLPRILALILAISSISRVGVAQDDPVKDYPKLSLKSDWPWWRGPHRNGIAVEQVVPTKLSETENLVWKTPVPFRGHSSPIVVGTRVYLTTADETEQVHYVVAFDRVAGKQLWQVEVNRGGFPKVNHRKNTEASPTLASDGERLFATFFHHEKIEAIALDFEGKVLWRVDAGPFNPRLFEYGYAPSPMIHHNSVIVSGEYDGDSFITGLDRLNGKRLWQTERLSIISFSTPVVCRVAGKEQMLLSGSNKVTSYDPADGKELWSAKGTSFATCGTIVWDGDTVFASGGFPLAQTVAVKADGSGEVLWKNNHKCYEQSMMAHQGYVYALTDKGVMVCWRGSDGKEMWIERAQAPVSASPVLAGGHIYWANEAGKIYVFRPNPEKFDLVAENQVGDDAFASPAICGGRIYLRVGRIENGKRSEFLYCFGEK